MSSVYCWEVDGGFAACILIKKTQDQSKKGQPMKGAWDSIHVMEVSENGRSAHYKLTSTVMLSLITENQATGKVNLAGSLTRQEERDAPLSETNTHIVCPSSRLFSISLSFPILIPFSLIVCCVRPLLSAFRLLGCLFPFFNTEFLLCNTFLARPVATRPQVNMGKMIEDMEYRLRQTIEQIYFSKTKEVFSNLRTTLPVSELERRRNAQGQIGQGMRK